MNQTAVLPFGQSHPNFRVLIIAGPSSVGKDAIAEILTEDYDGPEINFEYLTKYTNRKKRTVEADYYEVLVPEDFEKLEKNNELIFPFSKRGDKYGFSKKEFTDNSKKNKTIIMVYTHFQTAPKLTEDLQQKGITSHFILLEADQKTLERRLKTRQLLPDNNKRLKSIIADISYINNNRAQLEKTYTIIKNDNECTINNTAKKVIKIISDT